MNATQLLLAGSLTELGARRPAADLATETRALSTFRQLLDEVWRVSEGRLAKFALGLGLRSDQAADMLQDVYVMAVQKPPAIGDEAELLRWLFRVTLNRCRLTHRRHNRWRRLWSSLARALEGDHRPDIAADYGELKREVDRALATLGAEDRTLVVMRYFSDLNSRQIAEIVSMPEATVRGRLRAARRKLADELADWNDG